MLTKKNGPTGNRTSNRSTKASSDQNFFVKTIYNSIDTQLKNENEKRARHHWKILYFLKSPIITWRHFHHKKPRFSSSLNSPKQTFSYKKQKICQRVVVEENFKKLYEKVDFGEYGLEKITVFCDKSNKMWSERSLENLIFFNDNLFVFHSNF